MCDFFVTFASKSVNHCMKSRIYILFLFILASIVAIGDDEATDYDWNYGGGRKRNLLIFLERCRTGVSDIYGFKTFYYGVGNIRKK